MNRKEYMAQWYQKNKKEIRVYQKARYDSQRDAIHELKTEMGCIRCGESDYRVLTFHHKDPATKDHNVSQLVARDVQLIQDEIDKCDLLCANCHLIVEWEKRNDSDS